MTAPRRTEAAIAGIILALGIVIGVVYRKAYDDADGPQDLPKREFGAAVAMACGHGFVNPGYVLTPALDAFLTDRSDRMACSDLPAELPPMDLNATQRLYRYLMMSAGLVWKVTGVSWRGLAPLYAIAYGATLVAAYGIFRLGISRPLSVAATVGLALSAVHLQHLPFLRDYAKAPFILGLIFVMGRMATGAWSVRRNLIYSAAFGAVLGIGFGFRNDLLIVIAPWLAVVFLALPGSLVAHLRVKAACVAVSAAAFVIAAWPILAGYAAGSNTGHVAVLGLMTPFDGPLGVAAPIYDTGYLYNDQYGWTVVQSFAFRHFGKAVFYMEKEYDRLAVLYVLMIARHWPADLLARAYGSVLTVLELPFAIGEHVSMIPVGARGRTIIRFYTDASRALQMLNGFGAPMTAATLAIVSVRNLRAAIVLLFMVVYFAGYPALQFHVRHYFHLEFIGWFALAFLVDQGLIAARQSTSLSWRPIARGLAFTVSGVAALAALLGVTRVYQAAHARTLLRDDYLASDRESVETSLRPIAAGRVLVDTSKVWHQKPAGAPIGTEYLVAQFSGRNCDAVQVPATFRYAVTVPGYDFSRDVDVRLRPGAGPTVVMQAVFDVPGSSRFAGIELPAREAGCLSGVYRVKADRLPPILLDVNAPASWQRAKLYQTLTAFESPSDGEDGLPRLYSHSRTEALRPEAPLTLFSLKGAQLEYRNRIVADGKAGSLVIAGRPDTPSSAVLVLNEQPLPAGASVVARGDVRDGGIAFTLFRDGRMIDGVEVTTRGGFEAALSVPATGRYTVSLANRVVSRWRRQNDVTITAFGWMAGDAGAARSTP
jgi:hypothetical protein